MNPAVLVIAALIGVVCYKESAKFERGYGKAPGGVAPAAWGVLGFLFGLFGALALYICERSTKKRLPVAPPSWSSFDNRFSPPPPPQQQWAPPPSQATPSPGGWQAPAPPIAPPGGNVGGTDFLPRR
jgi:hypothetical protein